MVKPPIPYTEKARLQDLHDYGILDTPPEEDFDEIVRLASKICDTPISVISLVDAQRQWFKARVGLESQETSRDFSFCAHAILSDDIFVVQDAAADDRFRDNPLVTGDPDIRFYAGIPLISPFGNRMGTLCIIDRVPRNLTDTQRETLSVLGRQVVKLMELHKSNSKLKKISKEEYLHRKELERTAEMQKKIISIIGHDIRSPLHSLKSLLQLIPDKQAGIPQPGMVIDMAITQLNGTLGLLDNLVQWGRLQIAGEMDDYKECRLYETVKDMLREMEIAAEIKNIYLRNLVPQDIYLYTEENMLRFIVRNLLTNAVKFTKSGGITISAEMTGTSVTVKIQDTGIGVPAEILPDIFMGQKKTSRKGTQNEAGSGLGLSLVKEFVGKLNGSISAESEGGKGTTISFVLPSACHVNQAHLRHA